LIDITDQERLEIIDRFSHVVEAIKNNGGGWRAELSPQEAAKRFFQTFVEETGLDVITAKKKVLRVFPELEGVI
jgi:hypothetical protein